MIDGGFESVLHEAHGLFTNMDRRLGKHFEVVLET